jgi:sulfhydrogenase subunit alpha
MKKIKIPHLARVEGDGGITVVFEDDNKVKSVEMDIFEGPRLIEALAEGKTAEEIISFTPRICAICTVSHKNVAIRACEKALDYKVQEKTELVRELMHMGEVIESHSLHVFALALPDFLGYPNVVAMTDKYKDVVVKALGLKKYGNKIMKLLNGKFIHGENATCGGFGKFPANDELKEIKKESNEHLSFMIKACDIVADIEIPDYLEEETVFACCSPTGKEYPFWGDSIIVSDGKEIQLDEYQKHFKERVVPHSFAKRSLYKNKPFTVGALARINCNGDNLTGSAHALYKKNKSKRWLKNPLYNNLAQAIETVYALERIPELVDKIVKMKDPVKENPNRSEGRGVGAVEAPRGLLIHEYEFKNELATYSNIITPTAFNLDDIEKYIMKAAKSLLKEKKDHDSMRFEFEIIARAYDPCISCATHLVKIKYQ